MKKLLFLTFILLTVNQLAQAQTESIDRFVRKYKRSATGEKRSEEHTSELQSL